MKRSLLTVLSALALAGFSYAQDTDADNTGHNKKDAGGASVTAQDQSNDPADIKTTADIRKAVVADDSLSALAKNVKIVTVGQVVTLAGPVETQKEKAAILAHAKTVGAKEVKDEISIKQ